MWDVDAEALDLGDRMPDGRWMGESMPDGRVRCGMQDVQCRTGNAGCDAACYMPPLHVTAPPFRCR